MKITLIYRQVSLFNFAIYCCDPFQCAVWVQRNDVVLEAIADKKERM